MKIIKNEKLIKRNGRIGQWAMIAAFFVLGGGLYLTFTNGTGQDLRVFNLVLVAFVVGFVLMQVGLFFTNRYGGIPRVDEKLDTSLKGLPGDYTLYHFMTPASHLLVGPAGVWAFIPYRQRGVVTYTRNRWRVGNGGFLQAYMSIFGQEGIGRPDLEAEAEINSMKKLLGKNLSENEIPNVQVGLIFTNEAVEIQADGAPFPAMKLKQLKDFLRQKAKEKPISHAQLVAVKAALPEQSIST